MEDGAAFVGPSAAREPDLDAARRWIAAFRRIDRVEFTPSPSSNEALIHGVAHRLPVSRRVPRRVGLGLVELGYRATVRQRRP